MNFQGLYSTDPDIPNIIRRGHPCVLSVPPLFCSISHLDGPTVLPHLLKFMMMRYSVSLKNFTVW